MSSPSALRPWMIWLAVVPVAAVAFYWLHIQQSTSVMPSPSIPATPDLPKAARVKPAAADLETATFATGCFWCSQAVFERVDGVWEVTCGYMGGTLPNPSYEDVCTGMTGHAESVEVKFDPKVVSYEELLKWFWKMHDPTTLNRQGNDTGTQYRSAIFYYSDAQKAAAEKSKAAAQKDFDHPIVTEITAATTFYKETDPHHQEYFNNNASAGYCRVIIAPKLEHLNLPLKPTTATDPK